LNAEPKDVEDSTLRLLLKLNAVPEMFNLFVELAPSVKSILLLAGVISTSLGIYPYILFTLKTNI
jgi:hypothetical protein